MSRSRAHTPIDYSLISTSSLVNVPSPFASNSNFPSSRPTSRAPTPVRSDEEWHRMHQRRRSASRNHTPVPNYSEALIAASRRIRNRSIPPPPPPPYQEPSRPKRVARSRDGRPPLPIPQEPRVVASDYYKKYIKSIYEREPLFDSYIRSLPPRDVNLYKSESIAKIKSDFHDMIGDKWSRHGSGDPSVESDLAGKVYPWGNVALRDSEPASERLRRIQASRPNLPMPDMIPKLYVYHRSTWNK